MGIKGKLLGGERECKGEVGLEKRPPTTTSKDHTCGNSFNEKIGVKK